VLLKRADLLVQKGHCYGLIGQNGVGKTTLLTRIAAGDIDNFPSSLCVQQPCVEICFCFFLCIQSGESDKSGWLAGWRLCRNCYYVQHEILDESNISVQAFMQQVCKRPRTARSARRLSSPTLGINLVLECDLFSECDWATLISNSQY
jgi:energy-coupling factor transporter ATP-binding protein EcfA2